MVWLMQGHICLRVLTVTASARGIRWGTVGALVASCEAASQDLVDERSEDHQSELDCVMGSTVAGVYEASLYAQYVVYCDY